MQYFGFHYLQCNQNHTIERNSRGQGNSRLLSIYYWARSLYIFIFGYNSGNTNIQVLIYCILQVRKLRFYKLQLTQSCSANKWQDMFLVGGLLAFKLMFFPQFDLARNHIVQRFLSRPYYLYITLRGQQFTLFLSILKEGILQKYFVM